MTNFIKDDTALSYPKTRRHAVPSGASADEYLRDSDWNTICAGVDDLRNSIQAQAANVVDYGATGDGVTDDTEAIQDAIDTGRRVYLPPGRYITTACLTIPDNGSVIGAGMNATVVVANHIAPAFEIGDDTSIFDLSITSETYLSEDIVDTTAYEGHARVILVSGDRAVLTNIHHEEAAAGIQCSGVDDCTIINYSAARMHERTGAGAAVHCDNFANNIRGFSIRGEECDRFIEVENGSSNCSFLGGYGLSIYPPGYSGQPGGYLTYSFVLDAHSHDGEGNTRNVHFRDFLLEDCLQALSAQRSTGSTTADSPSNVSFRDIEIKNPRLGRTAVEIANALGVLLDRVFITSSTAYTDAELIKVSGSDTIDVRMSVNFAAGCYGKRCFNISSAGTVIERCYFGNRGTSTPMEMLKLAATDCVVRHSVFDQIKYSTADLLIDTTGTRCRVEGNRWVSATTNDPTDHVKVTGAECSIIDNVFVGATGASALCIEVTAANALISGNRFSFADAVTVVSLSAASSNCLVVDNIASTSNQTISDSGTNNTVTDNKRGATYG